MAINYSDWSVSKLEKEVQKIQRVIETKKSRDKKAAMAKLVAVAKESGFELHELIGGNGTNKPASPRKPKPKVKTRGKVAPKYKNPANSSETWTGRGRQPLWVKDFVSNVGSLSDILI